MLTIIINAFEETMVMVLIASLFTVFLGLPLGFILYGSTNKQFFANKAMYYALRLPITFISSTPYLIVTLLSIAFIKTIIGSNNSTVTSAILPLTLTAIPMFSLLTFDAIKKLPAEVADTVKTLGATPWQAITKIYLPEILPALIQAFANIMVQLIGYAIIAGIFGAGGIGSLIMHNGNQAVSVRCLLLSALLLAATVQIIQASGRYLAKQITRY